MGDNYFTNRESNGSINISDEVISALVKNAILEVEGVGGLSNTAGAELAELIGLKMITKGIEIKLEENKTVIDVIINVNYGTVIVDIARKVQENVLNVITNSAGIENAEVNVHVSGISFNK